MPLLQTRQVRTGLPCHGCHGCVAMRCCISLATFHQTSSDCSIFQATRRCKGSSRRLHFRGGLVCTHTHKHTHAQHGIDCYTAILKLACHSCNRIHESANQYAGTRFARAYAYFFRKFVTIRHITIYML